MDEAHGDPGEPDHRGHDPRHEKSLGLLPESDGALLLRPRPCYKAEGMHRGCRRP